MIDSNIAQVSFQRISNPEILTFQSIRFNWFTFMANLQISFCLMESVVIPKAKLRPTKSHCMPTQPEYFIKLNFLWLFMAP